MVSNKKIIAASFVFIGSLPTSVFSADEWSRTLEMAARQREMAARQVEMAAEQRERALEMAARQREMAAHQREMAADQRKRDLEMAARQREMAAEQRERTLDLAARQREMATNAWRGQNYIGYDFVNPGSNSGLDYKNSFSPIIGMNFGNSSAIKFHDPDAPRGIVSEKELKDRNNTYSKMVREYKACKEVEKAYEEDGISAPRFLPGYDRKTVSEKLLELEAMLSKDTKARLMAELAAEKRERAEKLADQKIAEGLRVEAEAARKAEIERMREVEAEKNREIERAKAEAERIREDADFMAAIQASLMEKKKIDELQEKENAFHNKNQEAVQAFDPYEPILIDGISHYSVEGYLYPVIENDKLEVAEIIKVEAKSRKAEGKVFSSEDMVEVIIDAANSERGQVIAILLAMDLWEY